MNLTDVVRYFRSPQVPLWKKAIAVLAVAYIASPVDMVPDVIPVLGWLDDVGVFAAATYFFRREVSKHAKLTPFSKAPEDNRG